MTPSTARRPPLDLTRLRDLPGPARDFRVEVVETAPSTNALLADRARGGEAEGLVLVAEHQTAGRGRRDRRWETPPRAALTFSVLLRPPEPGSRWPWLPLLTGVAVVEALRGDATTTSAEWFGLKWPNDVLCRGRKVAGILAERVETPLGAAVVLGVGLNVSTTRPELPLDTATSLLLEAPTGAVEPDRTGLLQALLAAFGDRYRRWADGGDEAAAELLAAYQRACRTVGQEVTVEQPSGVALQGHAVRVDASGALVVSGPAGRVAVSAGDVVHVRPAR